MKPGEIYVELRDSLLRYIRSCIGFRDEAEDILQDVFYSLVESGREEDIRDYESWMFRSARNRIIDWRRKKKMERLPFDDTLVEDMTLFLLDDRSGPEIDMLRKVVRKELDSALEEMSRKQREVFIANVMDGKSFKEISGETGIPVNTLLSRKHNAVKFLRKRMEDVYRDLILLYGR